MVAFAIGGIDGGGKRREMVVKSIIRLFYQIN